MLIFISMLYAQQNDNESVMDFANRIESLLVQLNRAATEAAPEEAKEHIRTNHAKLAKRSFEFGLRNPELRTVIISKNCSTITQTIKEAVELASYEPFSRSNTQSDSRRGTKYCSHCRKNNHNSNECFRTKNTVKTKPENNESDEGSKFCKYCKKRGTSSANAASGNATINSGPKHIQKTLVRSPPTQKKTCKRKMPLAPHLASTN